MTYLHEAKGQGAGTAGGEAADLSPLIESGLYAEATWIGTRRGRTVTLRAPGTPAGRVYDLASITKPFTASVALWCVSRGRLNLEEPVFPERLSNPPRLGDVLRHLGGAVAWWPLYGAGPKGDVVPLGAELWGGPRGVYSDVGYQTAARWIEQRMDQPLLDLLAEFVEVELDEVRLHATPFPRVLKNGASHADVELAGTSPCSTAKEVELASAQGLMIDELAPPEHGEPQDGNARWLSRRGLLAGHAGLYGSVEAVEALLARWVRAARGDGEGAFDRALRAALRPVGGRLLGWQQPPPEWGLPSSLFGHFGFTGGAIWADPDLASSMVLLAHRTDPGSDLGPSRRVVTQAWHRWAGVDGERPELPEFDW